MPKVQSSFCDSLSTFFLPVHRFFPLSVRVCGCKWLSSAGHVLSQWTLIDLLYAPTIAPQARRLDRLPAIVAHEDLLPENLGQAFDRPFAHTQKQNSIS